MILTNKNAQIIKIDNKLKYQYQHSFNKIIYKRLKKINTCEKLE